MVLSSVPSNAVDQVDPVSPLIQESLTELCLRQAIALPTTKLFGTDGIRGHVGDLLTPSLAQQVGFWAGQVLKTGTSHRGPIVLGQDSRNSSPILASALASGLTAAGLEVWNLGLCPTPAVAYLAHTNDALGGVMISASHNPPEDNGIKFFAADGTKLATALQEQIETALRHPTREGLLTDHSLPTEKYCNRPDLINAYAASLYGPLDTVSLSGLRVVLDLAWGSAVRLAADVFTHLGAEVICLHDQPDGDRINVNCGSTHLEPLRAAMIAHQADLGFAFDGDADRVMAVDAQGRVVDGDYILYLWGKALKQAQRLPDNTLIATVMSNLGFERAWEREGGVLIRTAVGDQHVHAEMLRRGAMLGGEQSGHILCHHYSTSGDGLLTALHMTALVQQANSSLAELVDQSFQTYPQQLRNVRVEDRDRRLNWKTCEPLQQAIAQAETALGDQGRILVRASGTEPVIRVMVEAATAELVHHWSQILVETVHQHF
jgi:phosphoglucosamine mutase